MSASKLFGFITLQNSLALPAYKIYLDSEVRSRIVETWK